MSHRRLAVVAAALVTASMLTGGAHAGPMPTAAPEIGENLELVGTTLFERDQRASLGLEASAAAGGAIGDPHRGGLATATLGLLAGLRGTSTNWLRFVGRAALPVYFAGEDGDDAMARTVETPRGEYEAAARATVNFSGGYSGFAFFSEARLDHGGPFGVGVRDASLGPGDFVGGEGELGATPRWHLFDDAALVLQLPLAYRVRGNALLDDAAATRSAGWVQHAFSTGLELAVIPHGPLRDLRFEFVGVEVSTIRIEPPVGDASPDVRAGANIERTVIRGLDGDYLFQLEDGLALGLTFGLGGVLQRSETILTGVVEHEAFIGRLGTAIYQDDGARLHLAFEREATHTADASEPAVGDTRLELGIAVPASLFGVGLALDSTLSWLDDLGREDGLSDTRFRMAIDAEAFYTAFEQLDIGAYYQVERNLLLEADDPTASWNPWQVGNRVHHEVAAFVRWRLDVD